MIFPHYLDKGRSRAYGRRVPLSIAINFPSKEQISSALKSLGLNFEIQENVAYPREPTKKSYRVIVYSKEYKKQEFLKKLAETIRELSKKKPEKRF